MNAFETTEYKGLGAFLWKKKKSRKVKRWYSLKQEVSVRGKNKEWYWKSLFIN